MQHIFKKNNNKKKKKSVMINEKVRTRLNFTLGDCKLIYTQCINVSCKNIFT